MAFICNNFNHFASIFKFGSMHYGRNGYYNVSFLTVVNVYHDLSLNNHNVSHLYTGQLKQDEFIEPTNENNSTICVYTWHALLHCYYRISVTTCNKSGWKTSCSLDYDHYNLINEQLMMLVNKLRIDSLIGC